MLQTISLLYSTVNFKVKPGLAYILSAVDESGAPSRLLGETLARNALLFSLYCRVSFYRLIFQ